MEVIERVSEFLRRNTIQKFNTFGVPYIKVKGEDVFPFFSDQTMFYFYKINSRFPKILD